LGGEIREQGAAAIQAGLAAQDGREGGKWAYKGDREQYGLTDDAQTSGAIS